MPTARSSTETSGTIWPITTIFSSASSTAAMQKGTYGSAATYGAGGV